MPFATVAPLVAGRRVSLSAGYALLLCGHTAEALSCLQEAVLDRGRERRPPAADRRLLPLLDRLSARLGRPPGAGPAEPLSLAALDTATPLLPPCMLALRAELCRRHRLPHRDRVTLSAFLKDAGLSLEENVRLEAPRAAGRECHRQRCSCGPFPVPALYYLDGFTLSSV